MHFKNNVHTLIKNALLVKNADRPQVFSEP